MEDILLMDAIERYVKGEMSKEEKLYFEELRKNTPEIDQMVVEHTMFLHQIEAYGANREMRHQLHTTHNNLLQTGDINEGPVSGGGKVIRLWNRYKKVTAIAATIASVTALVISGLVNYFTPANNSGLRLLSKKMDQIQITQHVLGKEISNLKLKSKVPVDAQAGNAGTSFLIDAKGYLATNAHVVKGSSTIVVQNNKGQEFKARIALLDDDKDLAILKIEDEDFKPFNAIPYSIKKSNTDLGEQIFTLGFPRDEIVYNEGYLSAKTGFNGDTMSCQIAVSANPGNSGGPVLNKYGEVIGILSTSQVKAEGVVFAIKSKNIYRALEELKKDTAYLNIKPPVSSSLKGMDRVQQIKQIEDCVFLVKSFNP